MSASLALAPPPAPPPHALAARLLVALQDCADAGTACPSNAALARREGCHLRTASRALTALREVGTIVVERRADDGARRILLPDGRVTAWSAPVWTGRRGARPRRGVAAKAATILRLLGEAAEAGRLAPDLATLLRQAGCRRRSGMAALGTLTTTGALRVERDGCGRVRLYRLADGREIAVRPVAEVAARQHASGTVAAARLGDTIRMSARRFGVTADARQAIEATARAAAAHARRVAELPPLTEADAARLVAEFLARKGGAG